MDAHEYIVFQEIYGRNPARMIYDLQRAILIIITSRFQ